MTTFEGMSPGQFHTWLVCQFCGRAAPRDDAMGWLDQPHRDRFDVRVVRCPEHWSEWSLRHTREGRTKNNRKRMFEALAMPVPAMPPHVEPFPIMEQEVG